MRGGRWEKQGFFFLKGTIRCATPRNKLGFAKSFLVLNFIFYQTCSYTAPRNIERGGFGLISPQKFTYAYLRPNQTKSDPHTTAAE